jgi:ABC-type glycerol-3-phosphate transport system substrate-binding protein
MNRVRAVGSLLAVGILLAACQAGAPASPSPNTKGPFTIGYSNGGGGGNGFRE